MQTLVSIENFSRLHKQETHNVFVKNLMSDFGDNAAEYPKANINNFFEMKNFFEKKVVFLRQNF
jgi:hypothetical protein